MADHEIIEAQPRAVSTVADNTPSAMLMLAVQRGDDMERIKQLMDLQDRWEASEARKAFNADKAAFKTEDIRITKDKENKQYKSFYTTLGNLVATVNPVLARHRLSADWIIDQTDGITVTCRLTHAMGHSESVSMIVLPDASGSKNPIQQVKSAITYAKAVTYESVCGLAGTDANVDDDGNGAGSAVDEAKAARGEELREMCADIVSLFTEGRETDALDIWQNPKHWDADNEIANEERKYAWGELGSTPKLKAFLKANDRNRSQA